jgi:hypothetical protein
MRLFNCSICDKGYPRQLDYENHLRSYDHNHRQRLADMKKLTASNDAEGAKPRQGPELQRIEGAAGGMTGSGKRFTKIGGAAGKGFKKVGSLVGKEGGAVVGEPVVEKKKEVEDEKEMVKEKGKEGTPVQDVVMGEDVVEKEEEVTWEEYDFTKPTGCEHGKCAGCKTDGIWGGGWVVVGSS